jgi:hypothetical protein
VHGSDVDMVHLSFILCDLTFSTQMSKFSL